MKKVITLSFILTFLASCKEKETKEPEKAVETQELFTVLSENTTGIHFNNELKETTYMNGLFYEYYYNGGGVAVADFNNDDLLDIYFVDCLKSNKLYLNQGDMKFKDVTEEANAQGGYGFGTGVTVVDINNDGLMDIYYSKSGKIKDAEKRRNELLINTGLNKNGIPVFEDKAKEYGLDLPDFTTQTAFLDYDKDGDLDMFVINHGIELYDENSIDQLIDKNSTYRGERLYQNNNGKFVNVSDKAGIINNMLGFGLGVAIGDLNNDLWPDIYVGNDFSEKDHLYINNQDGTFREVSLQSFGHVSNFSMGNDIADINNDGLLDIMAVDMMAEDNYTQKTSMSGMNPERFYKHVNLGLHHQYMYNTLQLNNGIDAETGNPMFSDIAQLADVSSTDWSWAPLFFDMDNNGYKDIFVSNGIKRDFRNNDFVRYRKKKQEEVIENEAIETQSYIKDLMDKMPLRKKENYFYLNNSDLSFKKLKLKQPESNSNGAAYADLDNDGDLDIVVNNSASMSFIYQNNTISENNYIKVKLKGSKDNVFAVGSRIELYSENGKQIAENYFSRGFQSATADKIHFGLGNTPDIDSIRVIWPDNKITALTNIKGGQELEISYPEGTSDEAVAENPNNKLFKDITEETGIAYTHTENDFNDFYKETLLPHRMSRLGPALAVADVNGDGLEDFFIGGAKDQASAIYLQTSNRTFEKKVTPFSGDSNHEDTGALFFDADQDGDMDLYVISGGYEYEPNHPYYQDRLYVNDGKGNFSKNISALPEITGSGLRISANDYDNDGDIDLFIGTRVQPGFYGRYSKSYLLENQSSTDQIKFVDVTESKIPDMLDHTMITASLWHDINNDNVADLIVANEWGPIEIFINEKDGFINKTSDYGLDKEIGWWSSLAVEDIDQDGDADIIAGNLGLNYKYKATKDEPFFMFVNDFDKNDTDDIVLGYQQKNEIYPVRGRECSSGQMPFIKKKFKTYNEYGSANIKDIYGQELEKGISYEANNFATSLLINKGTSFEFKPLENHAQLSSVNKIIVDHFTDNKEKEILLLGNLYGSEVETPRNDASYGQLLQLSQNGNYKVIPNNDINLWAGGDVKDASIITVGNKKALLIARNNDELSLISIN